MKASVVFNISQQHFNTDLPIRCFSQKQFLTSKYSSISHALLHSQSTVQGFHIIIFTRTPVIHFFTLTPTFIIIPFLF